MGRWYYGDIHGKCWFGVQSSSDASNFGVEPTKEYRFRGCGCLYEPNNPYKMDKMAFCSCYNSYEEHMEEIKDYIEDVDPDNHKTWHIGDCIYYDFTEDNLLQVQEVVKELDEEIGHYMKNFTLANTKGNGITYTFEITDKRIGKKKQEKIARLCLGLQIIKSIETNGSCSFHVET